MTRLRIGTRQSLLAQTQSRWVADLLRQRFPDLLIDLVLITTSGDLPSPSPLPKGRGPTSSKASAFSLQGEGGRRPDEGGGLKALFTKEIEDALLEGRIDLAVHSMKDMPAALPEGLAIGAVPAREDPRDAWISRDGRPFQETKRGARVGTGAVRRQAQLRRHRPDWEIVGMRGNVDTRLRKWRDENLDGLILALAGLRRLGRAHEATEILPADILLPAVGQGALAVEVCEKKDFLKPYLAALDHPPSRQAVVAERAFLLALGGSCQTPIAAYAQITRDELTLQGLVASPDGQKSLRAAETGTAAQAEETGARLAEKLLSAGARALLNA